MTRLFVAFALLLSLSAGAAPYRIAMVLPRDEQPTEQAFRDYLRKNGVDTEVSVLRYSGKREDAPALIQQLRQLRPDLIYTWGTPTTLAVAGTYDDAEPDRHIRDIPIVFTEVTDPLGTRLVPSLEQPRRNLTGVSHVAPLTVQLNTIRAYRPFKRLGYLTNPAEPNSLLVRDALQRLAPSLQFELVEETVPLRDGSPDPSALPLLVRRIAEQRVDFLYIGPSTFLAFTHRDAVTQAALDIRLPTFCATESIVRQAKCLFGLFSNGANVGRFAAYKAREILLERKPAGSVPAQTLQRFSLIINMPVAQQLDLYPPLGLLNVAEVVNAAQSKP
ncbi:ABC transporter substrate-binding protein [Chitinimonas lacunae]|uniref:ABC transporter substrate-binding protein n=1 Tax=Chitinimonas lacunae TaxID=1963018 RepID=A0ABV8MQY8_9NEIS